KGTPHLVWQWPARGGLPGASRDGIVGVIGHGRLLHHAVLDSLEPVVEEPSLLRDDRESCVLPYVLPPAVPRRTDEQLYPSSRHIAEDIERGHLRPRFIPIGGRIDAEISLLECIEMSRGTRHAPPLDAAELLCPAVTKG